MNVLEDGYKPWVQITVSYPLSLLTTIWKYIITPFPEKRVTCTNFLIPNQSGQGSARIRKVKPFTLEVPISMIMITFPHPGLP